MRILAIELQRAGIAFIEARATTVKGHLTVEELIASTPADLVKFKTWAEANGADVIDCRVATAAELAESDALSW